MIEIEQALWRDGAAVELEMNQVADGRHFADRMSGLALSRQHTRKRDEREKNRSSARRNHAECGNESVDDGRILYPKAPYTMLPKLTGDRKSFRLRRLRLNRCARWLGRGLQLRRACETISALAVALRSLSLAAARLQRPIEFGSHVSAV